MNVTRLCHRKSVLAVNGQFPGPTIFARKGDVVVVTVHNHGDTNITIHWYVLSHVHNHSSAVPGMHAFTGSIAAHRPATGGAAMASAVRACVHRHGVEQPRNPWSDGTPYITQCPIQPGAAFAYRVVLSQEEGTLWWHAHAGFDRATVHGAIVVLPELGATFPFTKRPRMATVEELPPIILGEWWNDDVNHLLEEARRTGGDLPPSNATTINGRPGDMSPCSEDGGGAFTARVECGRTHMLRVINAGLSNDMFFAVAGHRLTVVATDARYTKPFTVDHIMVASGQTVDALLEADGGVAGGGGGRYYMAARPFASSTAAPLNNSTATAVIEYDDTGADSPATTTGRNPPPAFPGLPAVDDEAAATRMLVTMAVNLLACAPGEACTGPRGGRLAGSLNNASFVNPAGADILRAYYRHASGGRGVYEAGFPDEPPAFFNFTDPGVPAATAPGKFTARSTKVKVLEHGAAVEVVFQDTAILGTESHPMHLHGFSFYVVGRGAGNFDAGKDPATYNPADPPCQNTVSVPKGGWAAIRFRAGNPGVWFMHCHFDRHMVWGMDTVFIVKDGKTPDARMMRPPPKMPKC
ncbi:hypothetical protein ACP4OV_013666 [Aristida adscensionis]